MQWLKCINFFKGFAVAEEASAQRIKYGQINHASGLSAPLGRTAIYAKHMQSMFISQEHSGTWTMLDIRDAVCADFDSVKMKVHCDELQADCTLLETLPRVKDHKLLLCNHLAI